MSDILAGSARLESIWYPYLWRKSLTLVVGDPGVCKTTLGYALAACLSEGKEFLGLEPTGTYSVMMLDFESSDGLIREKGLTLGAMPNVTIYRHTGSDGDMTLPEMIKSGALDYQHAENPFDVLIIDNLGIAFDARDENDNAEAIKRLKTLTKLAKQLDCAILVYHHPSKNAEATGTHKGSGAYAWSRYCDVHLNLNLIDEENGIVEIESAKNRNAEARPTRYFQKLGLSQFAECNAPANASKSLARSQSRWPVQVAADSILSVVGVFPRGEIVERVAASTRINVKVIDKALGVLVNQGKIAKRGYGHYEI